MSDINYLSSVDRDIEDHHRRIGLAADARRRRDDAEQMQRVITELHAEAERLGVSVDEVLAVRHQTVREDGEVTVTCGHCGNKHRSAEYVLRCSRAFGEDDGEASR